MEVFQISLDTSPKALSLDGRLKNIIEALTYDLYNYACTGLFEKHKLMLSFQMTIRILDGEKQLDHAQLDFFLKGNLSLEKAEKLNPFSEWFPEQGWQDLMRMIDLGQQFKDMVAHFEANEQLWRAWYDEEKPEEEAMPGNFTEVMNLFEQLLVLRCFRIDRITVALTVIKPNLTSSDNKFTFQSRTKLQQLESSDLHLYFKFPRGQLSDL